MKNNRGQALVEFIIIFPVFVFLLIGVTDFGNLLYQKYQLESDLDYIGDLYFAEKENNIEGYARGKKIKVDLQKTEENIHITVKKRVKIMAPGLNKILGNSHEITVERVFYDE